MTDFKSLAQRYVALSFRRPWLLLLIYMVSVVLAVIFGRPEIKTDLAELLPDHAPAVLALEEARARRVGGNEFYTIAIESPDPRETVRFMDDIAERLRAWDVVESVQLARDRSFFREHALLYLPVSDLRRVKRNIQRMIRVELDQQNPLFVDLSDDSDEANADDLDDPLSWIDPVTLQTLGIEKNDASSFFPFADKDPEDNGEPKQAQGRETIFDSAQLPEQYKDYNLSSDGRVGVVLARVHASSTDVEQSSALYDQGTALIAELDPASYHPEMRAAVVGAYRDFLEVRRLIGDVVKATGISLGLVLLCLILFFRNFRSVIIVILPLLVGVAWSLFTVTMIFGALNTLTAFIFSMLIGIGIDFGIHFYQRALQEYSVGNDWERAVYLSLSRTGRALLTASLTTILSLLVLLIASFDGFREFGVACAAGIALCLTATFLVAPPLIAALESFGASKRHERFVKKERKREPGGAHTGMRVGLVVVLLLSIFGFMSSRDARFEYDFRNLRGPSSGSGISYGSAVGDNRSAAPSVMLGESASQMREAHRILRQRLAGNDPYLEGFVTIETFLPEEQEARMAVVDEIYDVLDKRAVRNLGGEKGELVTTMLELTDTEPFTFEDLPDYVSAELVERDGSYGKLGLVYTDADWWNVLDVRRLQKHYSTIETSEGSVRIASSGYILDNVVKYVQSDAEKLAIGIVIVLLIVLLLDLRSFFAAFACLVALGGAVGMTVGLMATFDLKLGLYNMIVLPTILGVGVDGAIHLYHRYLEEGYENLWYAMTSTGQAVAASSLTTAAGFAGLLFTGHKGVETIGWLALAGIAAALVAVLGFMPGIISVFGHRTPRNPFETADYRTVSELDIEELKRQNRDNKGS